MSHFESSFHGLTTPTQAGLVLSILICAAMVATSPAIEVQLCTFDGDLFNQLVDVSYLESHGFSMPWFIDGHQDMLSLWSNKVHLLFSDPSPKVDMILEQARAQALNIQSYAAITCQQMHKITTEHALSMQSSFKDLMDTVSEKSTEWQEICTMEASSILQQFEASVANQIVKALTAAAQFSDGITTKGSAMFENARLQASNAQGIISSTATNLQRTVDDNLREMRSQLEQTLAHMHESRDHFRMVADNRMIREAALLKDKSMSLQVEAQRFMDTEMSYVEHLFVNPLLVANTAFWETFNVEVARETTIVKQTVSEMTSKFQATSNQMFAELKKVILPEATRGFEAFCFDMNVACTIELAKLQADFAKTATSIRDIEIPQAREAFRNSFDSLSDKALAKTIQWKDTISSHASYSGAQAISNLERWEETTNAEIALEQRSLAQFCNVLTQEGVARAQYASSQASIIRELITSANEQLKSEFESFKKGADDVMLQGGLEMKCLTTAFQDQVKSSIDAEIEQAERFIVDPMVEANRVIWDSFNEDLKGKGSVAKQTAVDITSQLQGTLDLKSVEFKTTILPEISRNTEAIYANSKESLSGEALKVQSYVRSLAAAFRDTDIPRPKDPIVSFSESSMAFLVAECSKLSYDTFSLGHLVNDELNSKYSLAQNEVVPNTKEALSSITTFAKEAIKLEMAEMKSFASTLLTDKVTTLSAISQAAATGVSSIPSTQAAIDTITLADASSTTETVVATESLSSVYNRLQSQLFKCL